MRATGRLSQLAFTFLVAAAYAQDTPEPGSADEECFPEALSFRMGPDGQLTQERTEPIAADGRPGKDPKLQRRSEDRRSSRDHEIDLVGSGRLQLRPDRPEIVVEIEEDHLLSG